jgi:hypothetical protein
MVKNLFRVGLMTSANDTFDLLSYKLERRQKIQRLCTMHEIFATVPNYNTDAFNV